MTTVEDVLKAIEDLAPPQFAFSFDRVGLQIGNKTSLARGVLCSLDCTEETARAAIDLAAGVIVSHHPLIWEPLRSIDTGSRQGQILTLLLANDIALIASHTNWDCAPDGLNDALAAALGLTDVTTFGSESDSPSYKLVTFAPKDSAESLLSALSAAGAGRIGLYERCAFLVEGTGTFRPLPGAEPTIGKPGVVESTAETRIETVVPEARVSSVIHALVSNHPYEEPAYDLVPIRSGGGYPIGRIGSLKGRLSFDAFSKFVEKKLNTTVLCWPPAATSIERVAVIGGAGDKDWRAAQEAGAQVLVTGEVRHDVVIEAAAAGMGIVQAGHYATEQPGVERLAERLQKKGFDASAFEPEPGRSGRPRLG